MICTMNLPVFPPLFFSLFLGWFQARDNSYRTRRRDAAGRSWSIHTERYVLCITDEPSQRR